MNNVQICFAEDGQPVARVTIPPPRLGRKNEVFRLIDAELHSVVDDLRFERDGEQFVLSIEVNPLAQFDTLNRMLLLQWMVKRLAEFSPPIDVSNLREVQRQLH
jgi:hypothetical protein